MGRSLQWLICQLHGNELPLRHLIIKLDGTTTGPFGFTGNIRKQLPECEKLPIVAFESIHAEEIAVDISDLSTDQKYLLQAYQAVSTGHCDDSLAHRNLGKMAHSRWLTTANRLLRLYMSTENPSDNFVIIIKFIMTVYAPMWFRIKCNPSITKASKHLHETIVRVGKLDCRTQEIKPVIQRNAYYGHHENIQINMIHDEKDQIRELGWRRTLKARSSAPDCVRVFKVPARSQFQRSIIL